ncbi:MAG TPA: sugar phosphate isomerase/epimerase family protein [Phycisphaerae bacterium]|nr:sugar phosphate isomerase/epimerase family protein [Phycisphaerae bacterium]
MNRRTFLRAAATAATLAGADLASSRRSGAGQPKPKFAMTLNVGQVGVRADPFEAVKLAVRYGYGAVTPMPWHLAKYSQEELERLLAEMKAAGLAWGAGVVSPFFDPDDAKFKEKRGKILETAKVLGRAGVTRCMTWTGPGSDTLTYVANFRLHVRRAKEIGKVLGDHGLRLGIEYLGTKTMARKRKFPFARSLAGMKEVADEVGLPNVGLTLDAWHWFQAGDTEEDILRLTNREVVTADICDAPAGVPRDQMPDSPRKLPCTTGVIDVKAFLSGLVRIGYDGPVGTEPFDKSLRTMTTDEAMTVATNAMKKAFALIE